MRSSVLVRRVDVCMCDGVRSDEGLCGHVRSCTGEGSIYVRVRECTGVCAVSACVNVSVRRIHT